MITRSGDGLHFESLRPWTFDDGKGLRVVAAQVALGDALGRHVSRLHSPRGRQRSRVPPPGAAVHAVLLAIVIGSGVLRERLATSEMVHRWSAHVFIAWLWLAIPFAIGAAVQRKGRSRPGVAIVQLLMLLTLLFAALLESFTGYLPVRHPDAGEETMNRFMVLHVVALPLLILVMIAGWSWAFRAERDSIAEER